MGVLISPEVLGQSRNSYKGQELYIEKVKKVVEILGHDMLTEEAIFQRLADNKAVSRNQWGRFCVALLILWGISDGLKPAHGVHKFMHHTGGKEIEYQLLLKK